MKYSFDELRSKYPEFIYKSYNVVYDNDKISVSYDFEITGLTSFHPTYVINNISNNNINKRVVDNLVFNMGMVELISYLKSTCSPDLKVMCGYFNDDQIKWWQKLYYLGLGEFRYKNNICIDQEEFIKITSYGEDIGIPKANYEGHGNIIAIGGGKDSNVTMEILKGMDNAPFVINPKQVHTDCINAAGYSSYLISDRKLDTNLFDLNDKGYLNGHTPISALYAFGCYLEAYLNNKKYIVLSNESSANEATVIGTNINHQYSKSFEFENDFNYYADKYLGLGIKYFSLLRCLNETQITLLFSKYKKYFNVFKSCNLGSKGDTWVWCNNCPKCLFVYIMLSAYLSKDELIDIFGEDLYDKESFLDTFKELLGEKESKPFECVGTPKEVINAVSKCIMNGYDSSFLLQYFKDNYELDKTSLLNEFNNDHLIPNEYLELVKMEMNKYVS